MEKTAADKTPKLTSVQCEACHGPGRRHMKGMLTFALTDEMPEDMAISKSVACTACHNPHVSHKKVYGKQE